MTTSLFIKANKKLAIVTGTLLLYLLSLMIFGFWSIPLTLALPKYDLAFGKAAFAFSKTPYPPGYNFAGVTAAATACILLIVLPGLLVLPVLLRTLLVRYLARHGPAPRPSLY